MTEAEIIAKCIKQDRRAQNELYKRYFPLISSIALRYTNNQDEVVSRMNIGFLKVLQNIETYSPKYTLATWIRNIMVNHLIDEFRKEKRYNATMQLSEYDESTADSDWNEGEQKLVKEELLAMLKLLPTMTEKIFNLFAIDGFKHREIAEMLNISEGTSKWHVSDARRRLKLEIEHKMRIEETQLQVNESSK